MEGAILRTGRYPRAPRPARAPPFTLDAPSDLPMNANLQAHRGTLILVLGIVGLVCCFPVGIAAWIMGNGDLKAMAEGRMDPTGEGMTKAGKICGIISVVLNCIGIVIWIAMLALAIPMGAMNQ